MKQAIAASATLRTPDGRYIVVRGRLWRAMNPALAPEEAQRWVDMLMTARRAVGAAGREGDLAAVQRARKQVDAANRRLENAGLSGGRTGRPI